MTGPECYKAALDCLDSARRASDKGRDEDATFWQREGQVLATLALAAATALTIGVDDSPTIREWAETAGQTEAREATA